MQDIFDIFKIGSALYPTGTVLLSIIYFILIIISLYFLTIFFKEKSYIPGIFSFIWFNTLSFFAFLSFAVSALNLQNYVLLKDAHGITIEEFVALEKSNKETEKQKKANLNSKAERLKRAEEKYNLSFDN